MLIMTSLDVLNKLISKHIENIKALVSQGSIFFELQAVSNTFIKWFLENVYVHKHLQMDI